MRVQREEQGFCKTQASDGIWDVRLAILKAFESLDGGRLKPEIDAVVADNEPRLHQGPFPAKSTPIGIHQLGNPLYNVEG